MKSIQRALLILTLVFASAITQTAAAQTVVFTGATLLPITSDPIENGKMVIDNGRIIAIGAADEVESPPDAVELDLAGHVIMPGIVDTHSHLGVAGDHFERNSPLNPQLRILDSFWAADPRIKVAVAGGITTANVMPGSGMVIGGQTIYIKLRDGTVDEMLVEGSVGGMKMANGENPKGRGEREKQAPSSRMATAALARQAFYNAIEYGRQKEAAENSRKIDPPPLDLGNEALLEILDGRRVVHHHTHRTDDIMTVLRLQQEFGFRLVIQHGIESYLLAGELASQGDVQVSYILVDSPGGKQEAHEASIEGAGILEAAGLEIALHSDDWIIDSRFLLRAGALAVRGGMSREGALRALTINPARMLDLGDRVGSLEAGKDADLVILDGDPFSVYTHVQQTWIDGVKRFDRSNPDDRLYATGGHGVADRYPTIGGAP